jgi:hypothetical protein
MAVAVTVTVTTSGAVHVFAMAMTVIAHRDRESTAVPWIYALCENLS